MKTKIKKEKFIPSNWLNSSPKDSSQKSKYVAKDTNSSWGNQAIKNAIKMIADSADGSKYYALRDASYLLGGYVGGGLLDVMEACAILKDAINKRNVNSIEDAYQTIEKGLKGGTTKPITSEQKEAEREAYLKQFKDSKDSKDSTFSSENKFNEIPKIRTARQRMAEAKNQPHIKQLLSMIWQTNELHLLFADTGVGKSILAVAISDAISKGKNLIVLVNENQPLTVLYYDFELSDRQFRKRYTNDSGEEHIFNKNFYIDNVDFGSLINSNPKLNFEDLLFQKIENDIRETEAKVLVIDNLTFLKMQSTQETQPALEVMRRLNNLKKEFDLSILVLAHTPKRPLNRPITINDLAGSKHLSNFADSISSIGRSMQGNEIRYIKQIKPSRSAELIYDIDNVITCRLIKNDCFLSFEFISFNSEFDHLNQEETGNKETPQKVYDLVKLLKENLTYDVIAVKLGISKGTITKWKDKYPDLFVSVSNDGK